MEVPHWPQAFLRRMQQKFADPAAYEAFKQALAGQRTTGLRVNPLKTSIERFLEVVPFRLDPVPWCSDGFYYDETVDLPGRHPLHAAGVFYIQEPSAMSVVPALDIQPGQWVLDLCAAPGGKSTQIAGQLQHDGLLVANEIHPMRVKALGENLERWGTPTAVITQEDPSRLAEAWGPVFQRVLLDAPCSGEGMFRKDEDAVTTWSEQKIAELASLQSSLLHAAHRLLAPGGILVYSTCTFNTRENEEQIAAFLDQTADMSLQRQERLWPHTVRGEGHFYAVLVKDRATQPLAMPSQTVAALNVSQKQLWQAFQRQFLHRFPLLDQGRFSLQARGQYLYLAPPVLPNLDRLKVLRSGVQVGQFKKDRFEPTHGLAMLLQPEDAKAGLALAAEDPKLRSYLEGQVLPGSSERGWGLISTGGHSLGWAKASGGSWKNHYPKGLRWRQGLAR